MRSLKKKRRIQIILLSFLALFVATGLIGYGFRDGINLYRSPSEFVDNPPRDGEVFRLGGMVEPGTLERGQGKTIRFVVTDGGASVTVHYTGLLPDLFSEGEGMIGTGSMQDDVFVATEILAKHDENYVPRELIDTHSEYRAASDGDV